jgi:hypothetical protein
MDVLLGVVTDANKLLDVLIEYGELPGEFQPQGELLKVMKKTEAEPKLLFAGGTGEACKRAEIPAERRDDAVQMLKEQGRIYQLGHGKGHTIVVLNLDKVGPPDPATMTSFDLLDLLEMVVLKEIRDRDARIKELEKRIVVQERTIRSLMGEILNKT